MTDRFTTLHDDGVLELTVSLTTAGNSLDHEAVLAGRAALQSVMRGHLKARSVLLTGRGDNFCAGGNVKHFHDAPQRGEFLRGLAHDLHGLLSDLHTTALPTVAAAQGWAAGAGMSIVLHADFAVGGPSSKLRPAYPGIGLSPEDLPRVGEKFFRADNELVQQQPGNGLGVAISRHLVVLHGGEFYVESEPGQGSTFGFTLPTAG